MLVIYIYIYKIIIVRSDNTNRIQYVYSPFTTSRRLYCVCCPITATYQLAYNGHLLLGSGYPIGGKVRDSPIDTSVSNVIDDASSSSEDLPLAITAQQANRAGLGFTRRPITWSSSLSSLSRTMSEYADVIIPSIIVCLLLLGNAIIVFYIYRLKRFERVFHQFHIINVQFSIGSS